jgi:MoaA/NifB/PqqE/SkfB family radical SAM enzyme
MPDSSVIPCCVSPYDDVYGDGTKQTLSEIWNSDKYKKLRQKMLAGEMVSGCNRCYDLEKSGFKSMRLEMNQFFSDYIPLAEQTKEDGSAKEINLKYIDIRFSNLCNFKCRGCGPTLSSSWFEDHQKLHGFNPTEIKMKSISAGSPDFWNELKSLIPHADVIYFGGGEPLITKEHYEILSALNTLSKHDIELRYNTNLSQLNYGEYNLSEYWEKFKQVTLSISIDDIGKRAEYFRHGTKWDNIEKNINTLMTKHPKIIRFVNCTVNIMNVLYLPEIYEYLTSKQIIEPHQFHVNLLLDPNELRIDVLPAGLKKRVTTKLIKFKFKLSCMDKKFHVSIKDIDNILRFMNETDNSRYLVDFQKSTSRLDELRNENFLETFPELESLITK